MQVRKCIAKHAAEQKNVREEFNSEYALEISKANANAQTVHTYGEPKANLLAQDDATANGLYWLSFKASNNGRDRDLLKLCLAE